MLEWAMEPLQARVEKASTQRDTRDDDTAFFQDNGFFYLEPEEPDIAPNPNARRHQQQAALQFHAARQRSSRM